MLLCVESSSPSDVHGAFPRGSRTDAWACSETCTRWVGGGGDDDVPEEIIIARRRLDVVFVHACGLSSCTSGWVVSSVLAGSADGRASKSQASGSFYQFTRILV